IFRQIISHDCLEESCGRSVGFPFHESLCNGEQCNCRVECSMRFLGEHSVVRGGGPGEDVRVSQPPGAAKASTSNSSAVRVPPAASSSCRNASLSRRSD